MFIGGQELRTAREPMLLEFVEFAQWLYQLLRRAVAVGRLHDELSMFKNQFATRLPLLAWLQFEFEKDASIGEPNRNIRARNRVGYSTVKIFVIIAGT